MKLAMVMILSLYIGINGAVPMAGTMTGTPPKVDDKKVWLFGMEGDWSPYSYQDSSGAATGMFYEMIQNVCSQCNVLCDMVYLDTYGARCFDPLDMTASGLDNLHYDACAAWGVTVARMNTLNFTKPYLSARMAQLYRRSDASDDIKSASKVGFRGNYYVDATCARRNGYDVPENKVMTISEGSNAELMAALNSNQVQMAIFGADQGTDTMIPVGAPFDCTEGGQAMMMRKDTDMSWWDKCMDEYRNSGAYSNLCNKWGSSRCL